MHVPISLHQPISDYAQDNHATVSCSYCKEQAEMWGSHPRDLCPSAPPVMQFPLEEKNHSFALRQYTSWFILTGTWWLHSLNSRKRNLVAFSDLEKAWQFINNSVYTFLSFQFLATKQKKNLWWLKTYATHCPGSVHVRIAWRSFASEADLV